MEGIVDRFESDRVVVEVGDRLLIFKRSIFPEDLEEGDLVKFKDGSFHIDKVGTDKRQEDIQNLFDSLLDRGE